MDIKRAKQEIKNTVRAYLMRDENGELLIPETHQRPVLLIGAPGIGKTAIMQQVARECEIGLVAYTMTHHTRQSALGLPFIREEQAGDKHFKVTEYTMSEIIASVYEAMNKTGLKEGILFIDEINCVSETLTPVMLQFLQGKCFGNAKVPEGWVIVAAGNPSEYNRSVREFDVVTLDRVKKIEVQPDYEVFREYALKNQVHMAVISYLDARRENFYKIETTLDGKKFVTARGWEDLSDLIKAYEKLGLVVDEEVTVQYLQDAEVALDFANYLSLYYKYEKIYNIDAILDGTAAEEVVKRVSQAPFDERVSVVSMILSGLNNRFIKFFEQDGICDELFALLKKFQVAQAASQITAAAVFGKLAGEYEKRFEKKRMSGLLDAEQVRIGASVNRILNDWKLALGAESLKVEDGFELLRGKFMELADEKENIADKAGTGLNHAFDFVEKAFAYTGAGGEVVLSGSSDPEMVLFVTELAAGFYSLKFIEENGNERFYEFNRKMSMNSASNVLADEIRSSL